MTFYEIKDKIDIVLYGCFNALSDMVFFFMFKKKKILRENIKYKDIHKGERCFILGTGPSLNDLTREQIDKLKNEITFGVNSLYKAEIVDAIIPNYYALVDNLYFNEWFDAFNDVHNKYVKKPPIIITDYRILNKIKSSGLRNCTIFLYSKKFPFRKIDDNIGTNSYIAQNVLSVCILIAIYMGFKEINLLGLDYSQFAHRQDPHCYDDSDENTDVTNRLGMLLKFYTITTEIHYLIAKLAKKRGVKIVNMTPNSLLDAYPIDDLSVLFEK